MQYRHSCLELNVNVGDYMGDVVPKEWYTSVQIGLGNSLIDCTFSCEHNSFCICTLKGYAPSLICALTRAKVLMFGVPIIHIGPTPALCLPLDERLQLCWQCLCLSPDGHLRSKRNECLRFSEDLSNLKAFKASEFRAPSKVAICLRNKPQSIFQKQQ